MKPLYCVILALATTFVCTDLSAQDRKFGNGRFLKRIRDDIAKSQQKLKESAEKARTPTPAPKKGDQANGKTPTPASRPNPNVKRTNPYSRTNPYARKNSNSQVRPPTQQTRSKANDFGLVLVRDKNDDMIVAGVVPNGNAAKVGIRRGDKIKELGGAEFTDAEELDSIAKILKPGDQMEFTIESRGKTRKELVQWGVAPEIDESVERDVEPNDSLRSVIDRSATDFAAFGKRNDQQTIIEQRRQIERLNRLLQQRATQQPRPPVIDGPSIAGPGK